MKLDFLFLCMDNKVQVFRYDAKARCIEALPKNEGYEIDLDDTFWKWWKKAVEYQRGDECDFCLIWHNSDDDKLRNNGINDGNQKSQVWNRYTINLCFDSVFNGNYDIKLRSGTEEIICFKSGVSTKCLEFDTSLDLEAELQNADASTSGQNNSNDDNSNSAADNNQPQSVCVYKKSTAFDIYFKEIREKEKLQGEE